ncbi:hypothetical protein DXG01_007979 [Tephrocybe rancida]|nr:hypothetical protein DXG01_007979 [Tephrocybe rancida]
MYNGIGLTTPRGSGTNGYVVRNLSTLRSHETSQDRASAWDSAPPKHREPDEAILEHERKRKVEVKCLELQLDLEDKGVDEDEIEQQVGVLRAELLKNLAALAPSAKSLKSSDTHGLALAKKAELSKMARAFGTRSDYQEGEAFDREKQEEIKVRKQGEREERERKKEEERSKYQEQKAKWEAEKKERDRLRRREEDRLRKEREEGAKRRDHMPPPPLPAGKVDRGGDRKDPRDYRDRGYQTGDRRSRSRSPPRRRDGPAPRERVRARASPTPSPPPRNRPRYDSRSRSRSPSRSVATSPQCQAPVWQPWTYLTAPSFTASIASSSRSTTFYYSSSVPTWWTVTVKVKVKVPTTPVACI